MSDDDVTKEYVDANHPTFTAITPTFTAITPPRPMYWLTFSCGLRVNMATGEVVIPEGLALDEASRAFWENLARYHPSAPVGFG